MKKLMFAAAVIAAGVATADVSSANIVGYANKDTADGAGGYNMYCTVGSMFATVGDQKTFSLNQMKINAEGKTDGGAYLMCKLQVIDPSSSKVDQSRIYTYWGADDGANPGDPARWLHDDESELEDGEDVFPVGTAFLCNFNPNYKASVQFAGEVVTADEVTISTEDPANEGTYFMYLYVVNPIAADLNLHEDVKINADGCTDGGAYLMCKIQIIDPESSKVDQSKIYTYWGANDGANPGDPARWLHDDESELENGEEVFPMGAGFLCNFNPNYKASIVFKNKVK